MNSYFHTRLIVFFMSSTAMAIAAPLTPHTARSSPQDLAVTMTKPDGTDAAPVYYTYDELATLPQVTVKTETDPNTGKSATYTGVLVRDLFAGFGAAPEQNVITMTCYDGYQQFYDSDYDAKHSPILLLKFDGLKPEDWPKSSHDTPQGPYSIVYEKYVPAETIYGYVQPERIPYGIVSAQIMTHAQFFDPFASKTNVGDPEVAKGQRIAMGSCISCHNIGDNGGAVAQRPWLLISMFAVSSPDYFRKYVVNPPKMNPLAKMPAHPSFDDKTLDALRAYFHSIAPH